VAHQNPSDDDIRQLLSSSSTIAVVGASSNPDRSSNNIVGRLLQLGYRVIPINPNETEVLGQKAYPSLSDVPVAVDIVDVFRRAEHTPAVADEAVKIGAKALWLQQGIRNEDAAARAEAGGLTVVMDACIAVELAVLQVRPKRHA
jgi:predicted CoA-binding protein